MATDTVSGAAADTERRASWIPIVAILLAQLLLVLNVTMLKVSIEDIAESLSAASSWVKSAIVAYALSVAALITTGAKLDELFGVRRMFRVGVLVFAASMTAMALSRNVHSMIVAQIVAGAATGALAPALVILVTDNYRGNQRATAMGWLAAAQAMSIVPGILLAGLLATWPGWRYAYGVFILLALGVYALSEKVVAGRGRQRVSIDVIGVLLAAMAVYLIGTGCNNLYDWGAWRASERAPFDLFQISPAPLAIAGGALLVRAFIVWSHHVGERGGTPLVPPEAFASPRERAALLSMFLVAAIGAAITCVIPLYIEVVQGRSVLYTALALAPFAVAGFAAAALVVRVGAIAAPRRIAAGAFLCVAIGAVLTGATIRNDWNDLLVMLGMAAVGFGEGALGTLLFKLLVTCVAHRAETEVSPLCGSAEYLAVAIGTALSSALIVGVLASGVQREVVENPLVPESLKAHVDLESPSFVSNDRLRAVLARANPSAEQVAEAVRINTEARLDALRACFFALAALAVLALLPAWQLSHAATEPGRARLDP